MKWTLAELHRYATEPLHIDSTFDLNASLTKRFPETILHADKVHVNGYVSYHHGDATINADVQTVLTVPSSRSLEPVELPLHFSFSENYIDDPDHRALYEDNELVFLLGDQNETIDLDTILVENIFEQIPTKILSEQEKNGQSFPSGKGWEVVEEDKSTVQDDHVDPRFAKLKNLFPDQDNHH